MANKTNSEGKTKLEISNENLYENNDFKYTMEVGYTTKDSNQTYIYQEVDKVDIKEEIDNNILLANHQHINDNNINFLKDTTNTFCDKKDNLVIKEENLEIDVNDDLDLHYNFEHVDCKIKEEVENNIALDNKMVDFDVISTDLIETGKDDQKFLKNFEVISNNLYNNEDCSDRDNLTVSYSFEHVEGKMRIKEELKNNPPLADKLNDENVDSSDLSNKEKDASNNITTSRFKSTSENHKPTHTEGKSHVCDVCHKSYPHKIALRRHRRIHTGQKPHVCHVCQKAFTQAITLRNHILIHTGEKNHVCNLCKRAFRRTDTLNKHKLTHTGEKLYACEICNKRFTSAASLKQHKILHTDEFTCDICSKTFTTSVRLRQHRSIHTGEKLYVCDVDSCNKAFAAPQNLVSHKRIHDAHTVEKRYVCDVCDRGFSSSGHLKQHRTIHTGVKNHVCDVCRMAFAIASKLKRHQLVHAKKPHVCEVCYKTYTRLDSFQKHILTCFNN